MINDQMVNVEQEPAIAAAGNDDIRTPQELPVPWVAVQNTTALTESESDPVHACTGNSKGGVQPVVASSITARETKSMLAPLASPR